MSLPHIYCDAFLQYRQNQTHCCGQDELGVIRQDFKNQVKKQMSEEPRAKFGKVVMSQSNQIYNLIYLGL